MKRLLLPFAIAFSLSALALFRTDGFSFDKVHGELKGGVCARVPESILPRLQQRYTYLAKGRQCFVFVSADGKTVLKFLNYRRFYFPRWILCLPVPQGVKEYAAARARRYGATLESFELAYEWLSQETGIEYLHLQRGEGLPEIELTGPGFLCRLDLNEVAFVLQKRADVSIFEKLEAVVQKEGEGGLRRVLSKILALLKQRCDLGIADNDRDIEINFGFYQDEPLLLDPGRLVFQENLGVKEKRLQELQASTKKLHAWLLKRYPASAEWLDHQITD